MNWLCNISLTHYLVLALALFLIGFLGVVICKNVIKILISVELMLNAVSINFVAFAAYNDGNLVTGMIFALFVMAVSATQVAVGIAILLAIFNHKHTVNIEKIGDLKG